MKLRKVLTYKEFELYEKESKESKEETTQKDRKEEYDTWKKLVNMNTDDFKDFLKTDTAKESMTKASSESSKKLIKMKITGSTFERAMKVWDDSEWDALNKQVSFISMMKGNKNPLKDEDGKLSKKAIVLKLWGHDSSK